jgi:Zn-dependent peptidase ImmA (M78 family)
MKKTIRRGTLNEVIMVTPSRINNPTVKAREVLAKYWDGELPIDPSAIAKKMGIVVTPVTCCGYSGKAFQEDDQAVIEYDRDEYSLRQRFTIAHELGHHVLGHTGNGHQFRDEASKFNLNVPIPEESQANKFAAELLAPEMAIKHLIFKEKINSLTKLAEKFSVSTVAMKYRLTNLGLL